MNLKVLELLEFDKVKQQMFKYVKTEKAKATVITDGMSAGSFRRDPNGREVDIVTKANKELFFQKMDEILERTK